MERFVVGLDRSTPDTAPLRWAADYCRLAHAELVAAASYEPTDAEISPDRYEELFALARKEIETTVDAAATDVPHRVELGEGDLRRLIAEAAADNAAAAVIVGAHGAGGFHHLGLGTVAHHLARVLPMPLVSVPATGPRLHGGTVVVGLDGSPGDVSTLAWAVRLAEVVNGPLRAAYALDPMAMSYPHPPGATRAEEAEAVVKADVASVAAGRVDVALTVDVDDPIPALVRAADEQDAAVVVVGRKGVGHLRGLLLGRVPAELPFVAHRAVAIVPRASTH